MRDNNCKGYLSRQIPEDDNVERDNDGWPWYCYSTTFIMIWVVIGCVKLKQIYS